MSGSVEKAFMAWTSMEAVGERLSAALSKTEIICFRSLDVSLKDDRSD